jgi:endonuclease YncB( thermonuclease family)
MKTLSRCPLLLCLALFVVLAPSIAAAKKQKSYGDFKNVRFVKNYDGDTITVDLKGQHPLFGDDISVRVAGVDTPEIKGKCSQEKELAREAKKVVHDLLKDARIIKLKNVRRGKYFRIVADVYAGRKNVADVLVKKGLAVRYDGGTKTYNWCKGRANQGSSGWGSFIENILK